ncbi:CPBP family intramembrane glutamic endopeptidase [Treponema pectinovorum]|uniref:CPBP family intramembrane glutamic endopeptidase n=2 Tax=Treponema pectinovorum TaxID=164 RepID=UPI0011C86864|nr:CPBP family intramembrane glutamic endopeptidase [Treponema pectinovorum]
MIKFLPATEFIFVVFFFVVLPILTRTPSESQSEFSINFSFFSFFMFLLCALLFYFHRNLYKKKYSSAVPTLKKHSDALISFGLLFLISCSFELAQFLLLKKGFDFKIAKLVFDFNFFSTISLLASLICASFCEEILYRFYLPDFAKEIFSKNKITDFFIEAISVFAFAVGHIYLGLFGFLNAFFSGIVLRFLLIKAKNIWICFLVHFFYNLLTFVILQAI